MLPRTKINEAEPCFKVQGKLLKDLTAHTLPGTVVETMDAGFYMRDDEDKWVCIRPPAGESSSFGIRLEGTAMVANRLIHSVSVQETF